MTPVERGRLCEFCSRKIYDLSLHSNAEIEYLIKSEKKICGRKKIEKIKRNFYSLRKIGLMFSLSSIFMLPQIVQSKHLSQINKTVILQTRDTFTSTSLNQKVKDSITIYGNVTELRIPLPKATVQVKGTKFQTETDINGNFQLTIPKEMKEDILVLEFSFIGMNSKEIKLKNLKRKIKVELESTFVLGEVIFKKSFWSRIFR